MQSAVERLARRGALSITLMPVNRRNFLQQGAALAALLATSSNAETTRALPMCRAPRLLKTSFSTSGKSLRQPLNPSSLARFVDPLPIPEIAASTERRASPDDHAIKLPYYRIEMRETHLPLHRDLPPTRQWSYNGSVPGPTFETRSGEGVLVEWVNALPARHFLPVDRTIHGAEMESPQSRTVAHLHGAKVPPGSDGYPENWYGPGKSALYHYPNQQDAATLWYHDHAMGITRLNIFAGLLGTFIVRDAREDALNLPRGPHGECDIPLMLYDRTLDRDGQLLYPESGDPDAPWVPEFYGNLTLCNGKIFPYLEVEPRRYRFRLINVANGRFFNLSLSNGVHFQQIGSDQGLLPAPVESTRILLFPAERADVVIDFTPHRGEMLALKNQNDELMQFRVSENSVEDRSRVPKILCTLPRMAESDASNARILTLAEHDDYDGNSRTMLLNGRKWGDPVSERPVLDTIEIWSLVNLTGDVHPIHLHLVRFQILDRRPFDLFAYNASQTLNYTGPALPPAANEAGWKDTVRADPGVVTRIIVRFEGYAGRYVWHCHLLEHEDNEMMRPYEIVAATEKM